MKKTLLVALFAFPLVVACKKEEEKPKSRTELLTEKNWQVRAATSDPALPLGGTLVTDVYAQLPACAKDDIERFDKPNIYKDDQGSNRCDPSAPQTATGTWVISPDDSRITITESAGSYSYEILELNDNTLKVRYPTVLNGITYNITATYNKL